MLPLLKHVYMRQSLKKLNFMKTRSLHDTLNSEYLTISDRVKAALCTNKPIVALESTIITHGLPWPNNYETAIEIENIIDSQNVVPATIGFLNGKLKVGLDQNELELIAKSHQDAIKISRRDLSYMFAQASTNKQLIGGIFPFVLS
jgi:pseudouridine-5'-phosphate glycosidase